MTAIIETKMMNADDPYTYGDYVRSLSNLEIAVWAVDTFLCERCVHAYGSRAFSKCDARQRIRCLDDVKLFLDMEVEE